MNIRKFLCVNKFINAAEISIGVLAWIWLRCIGSRRVVLLAYHSISYSPWIHAVSPELFSLQMNWLKKYTKPIPVSEALVTARSGQIFMRRPIVGITFDDGYADWIEHAGPILQSHLLPATFFVVTSFTLVTSVPQIGLSPMQPELVSKLSSQGFTIGSHTHLHHDLSNCSDTELVNELTRSRNILEHLTGKNVSELSYPKGRFRASSFSIVEQSGYKLAVAGHGSVTYGVPIYAIPRLPITKDVSFRLFRARVLRLAAWGF
ncbi:polysaccharide deacetylase family protein [Candidatus Uhrbacteria bacterium]|nr:polysaccharide deacetylase family protein [Candidatus Uhrbacteria bacterium]